MGKTATDQVTVGDLIEAMERLAPMHLAEEWDNCGLQVGSRLWPVQRVWVALDPLPSVVHAAVGQKVDLLISHHPLLFHPLRAIDLQTSVGRTIETALTGRLALYAAHTNLDSALRGVNDVLARALGLRDLTPLVAAQGVGEDGAADEMPGMGRMGRLQAPQTLRALAEQIKARLHLASVKFAGDPELIVDQVAVCSGSGASLVDTFLDTQAQVYVSGDLRYHDARTVEQVGRALIDIGHFSSEHLVLDPLAGQLRKIAVQKGWQLQIEVCPLERDPLVTL